MRTPDTAPSRTWFITGASRGLGRAFALAALERGDHVAAAARTVTRQDFDDRYGDRLLALPLDVTDRDAVFAAVNTAVEHFGRLDIVVNNAGTMSSGMVEEFTEAEARAQLEVNLFGAMWVCQAVLPHLRAQASGHIVQVSSIAALGGFPSTGHVQREQVRAGGHERGTGDGGRAVRRQAQHPPARRLLDRPLHQHDDDVALGGVRPVARRAGEAVGRGIDRQ